MVGSSSGTEGEVGESTLGSSSGASGEVGEASVMRGGPWGKKEATGKAPVCVALDINTCFYSLPFD